MERFANRTAPQFTGVAATVSTRSADVRPAVLLAVTVILVTLSAAGVPNEIVTYPGAPHSFFDRKQEDYADASADAWARVLDFIRANTPGA